MLAFNYPLVFAQQDPPPLRPCSVEVVFEGEWRGLRGIRSPTSQNPLQSTPIPLGGGLNEQGLKKNMEYVK